MHPWLLVSACSDPTCHQGCMACRRLSTCHPTDQDLQTQCRPIAPSGHQRKIRRLQDRPLVTHRSSTTSLWRHHLLPRAIMQCWLSVHAIHTLDAILLRNLGSLRLQCKCCGHKVLVAPADDVGACEAGDIRAELRRTCAIECMFANFVTSGRPGHGKRPPGRCF